MQKKAGFKMCIRDSASDVYQGTYQYDELVDMQFVENAQKQN